MICPSAKTWPFIAASSFSLVALAGRSSRLRACRRATSSNRSLAGANCLWLSQFLHLAVRWSVLRGGPFEQSVDLLIGRLREIAVPEPDGIKGVGRAGTDDFVGFILELRAGLRGTDGDGNDDPGGLLLAQGGDRRPHRGPRS